MKRKIALLALPLVLFALVWSVKWRIDHPTPPTPTQEDLKIRALLMDYSKVVSFTYFPPNLIGSVIYDADIHQDEMKPFIDCFCVLPKAPKTHQVGVGEFGFAFHFDNGQKKNEISAIVRIKTDKIGEEFYVQSPTGPINRNIHPATAKLWIALLFSNPRIGSELRARGIRP